MLAKQKLAACLKMSVRGVNMSVKLPDKILMFFGRTEYPTITLPLPISFRPGTRLLLFEWLAFYQR